MKPYRVAPEFRRANSLVSPETYPFEMGYLPEKFVKKAEDELNETPEAKEKCLQQIRELIRNEKNLKNSWLSDEYLLQYLRGRKFNVQKAFNSLKKFISFVRRHKNYFQPLTPEAAERVAAEKPFSFQPNRDKDGCAILVIYLSRWNPSEIHIEDVVRLVILFLSHAMKEPMTQVNGFKILFDVKVNPLRYIRYCTPFYAYLMYHCTQECIPARFKGIHVLNPSLIFRTFWPFIVPFLPEKLKKRIFIHDSGPRLHNYLPDCLIPPHYGGQMEDYDFTDFVQNAKLPEVVRHLLNEET